MANPRLRNTLVLWHLLLAGFLAPAFLLVGYTGAAYLLDFKGSVVETEIAPAVALPDAGIDSPEMEAAVRDWLAANALEIDPDYLRTRPGSITTRPTTRDFVTFDQVGPVWTATLNEPDLQYSLIELHKGHGPQIYRYYQIGVGVLLLFVILGGLVVGVLSPAYRGKTIGSLAAGSLAFVVLAFVL